MISNVASAPSSSARRELRVRVGIVLDGTLVDERLLARDLITIGQSSRNTFSVPVDGAPRAWPLFRRVRGGHVVLGFSDEMDGRLSLGGAVHTFSELRARGASRSRGGWSIALSRGARGKLSMGAVTVLFQLLEVPVRPRPMLPRSIRGGLAERINPALLAIIAVSLIAHGSFAYWLYQRDVPARTTLQRIGDRAERPARDDTRAIVVSAELLDRLEPPPPPAPGADVPVPGEPLRPRRDRPRGDRPGHGARDGGLRPMNDARIRELVDGTAAISVLTGGPNSESRYGRIASKDPGGDLDRSLKFVASSGREIVTRRPQGLAVRDGGDRGLASGHDAVIDAPRAIAPAVAKHERRIPTPTIEPVDPLDPDGIDPSEIAHIIRRRYLEGIRRCHSDLLGDDASASGRVDIEFTVNRVGKVISARVNGFDPALEQCVEGLARRWRFPVAKADGVAIEASYATTFVLKAP